MLKEGPKSAARVRRMGRMGFCDALLWNKLIDLVGRKKVRNCHKQHRILALCETTLCMVKNITEKLGQYQAC